jgi:phosphate-selective porin OprO/OprP
MNFKLRSLVAAAVAGSFMMGFGANAMADSTDDILNALIAKGVLTEEEGALLMKGRTGEKEAAEAKKKSAVSAKYKDGIVLETGDGKNSLQMNGRVHFDSRTYDYNESDNQNLTASGVGADTFDIRRARIGAKVKFGDYYSGEVVFNGVGNAPVVDVAYVNAAWWKPVQFRAGLFKMPFSLEQLTSSNNIDFIERSFVDAYIPAKEIGAMVHGEPIKGTTYALAMSNGSNAAETDTRVDNKDLIARVTANFAEIMENKDMVLHAGLALAKGDIPKGNGLGDARTESRGVTFFDTGAIASNNTFGADIDRTRMGLEAVVAHGPFKFQTQYLKTNFDYSTSATASVDEDIKTWYAEALWTITGESHADRYKAGAFGGIKPKNDFNPENFSGGAWEVGARYSKFDAKDFNNNGVALIGAPTNGYAEADALTLGVKFVASTHVRFMLDYVKTDFEDRLGTGGVTVNNKAEDSEKALLFRTQFAF